MAGQTRIGWLEVSVAPDALILHQIHLIKSAQGQGLGTALLRHLIQVACRRNVAIRLYVVRNNPARALYRRLGFKTVASSGTRLKMILNPGKRPSKGP